jgi:hypothetical protein
MTGEGDKTGTPILRLAVAGQEWVATIDTGFNGDLELPDTLAPHFTLKFVAESVTTLAGGKVIVEDIYSVQFPFDGEIVQAEASFAPTDGILIGTGCGVTASKSTSSPAPSCSKRSYPPDPPPRLHSSARPATMNLRPPRRVPPDARPL